MTENTANETEASVNPMNDVQAEFSKLVLASKEGGALAMWSDVKKKDYVRLFHQRANAAIYLLRCTSYELARLANEKHFFGTPKFNELREAIGNANWGHNHRHSHSAYGCTKDQTPFDALGRDPAELNQIVAERVKVLLRQLPSLNKAMEILDPVTLEKMIKRDELLALGQEKTDEYTELSEEIALAELDQNMTIGAFRQMVKDRENRRRTLLQELDALGKEGQELEKHINKTLYKGMPGISDEIYQASYQMYQNSMALDQTKRRVEELVLYGDNDAALETLQIFANDEIKLNEDVGARFAKGLESLKAALKKKKKGKGSDTPAAEPTPSGEETT